MGCSYPSHQVTWCVCGKQTTKVTLKVCSGAQVDLQEFCIIWNDLEEWLRSSAWKKPSSSKASAISFLQRSSQSISICEDPRTTWRTKQTSLLRYQIAWEGTWIFLAITSMSVYLSQSRVQKSLQITQSFTAKAMNTSAACASSSTVCPRVPSWVRRAKMQQRPCPHPRQLWRNAWKSIQGKRGVIPQSHTEFLGLVESMQCPSQTSTSLWRDFHSARNHPEPDYLSPPFAKWLSRSVATCNPAVKQNLAVCEALHSALSYPICQF